MHPPLGHFHLEQGKRQNHHEQDDRRCRALAKGKVRKGGPHRCDRQVYNWPSRPAGGHDKRLVEHLKGTDNGHDRYEKVVGDSSGIVIWISCCHLPAPSISAAS